MQVVESAVLERVATPEPKHATRLALAGVKVVPPLAVTKAILQGDCCTTTASTASAGQAMIPRHERHMQDEELACLNQSYRSGHSKKLPAARDAERHLHCRLVLTVLLPADQNFDRYFHSIEVDEELDAIRLSFRDLRCSHWRAVAESCGHCSAVPAVLEPAAGQNLGRHFHSIGADVKTDVIRLSFHDLRCSHWRAVAESCGHYSVVPAVLEPAAGQNPARHFHSIGVDVKTDVIRLSFDDLRCSHWMAAAQSCGHYPAVLEPAARQNLGRYFYSIGADAETDAIRLSLRDLHCSHWRAVAESCGHYPVVPPVLEPAAPGYPARDRGH
jgi:hypothetical protein